MGREEHSQRVTKELREQSEKLNWDGIEFPIPCSERMLKKFENNNDVSVLVFGYDNKDIIPLYVPVKLHEKVVRLFFYRNEDGTESHYCVIRSMSRLVSSQISKEKAKKYICDFCLNAFGNEDLLNEHVKYCSKHDAVNVVMPKPEFNDTLKFKNIQNSIECPVKLYADLESFLESIDEMRGETKLYQKHVPSTFSFYVVSRVEDFSMDPVTYTSQNKNDQVNKIFLENLEKIAKEIYETFKESKPMIFDENAKRLHESQNERYACGEKFNPKSQEYRKVRDHCHYTGKYRGALHSKCNLRLKKSLTIPVFFHNLTGYDSHLFVKRLADSLGDVNCIPRNEEKYITFNKHVLVDTIVKNDDEEVNIYMTLQFKDTVNFMQSSLEKLVGNMEKSDFKHTSKYFQEEKLDLMMRKGIYPYEYMTEVERFWEKELPQKEKFASSLGSGMVLGLGKTITPSEISDEDYSHAQKVFKTFNCENLADYTKLYCKSDVLLLAEVFQTFIDVCLKKYGLDPSHYLTAPSLSMDAMLKMTEIELELLTDVDMHLFFEKGIRGGISTVTGRYSKANNPYMEDYDPEKETTYIQYLDANNLYGWAMSQYLPVGNFKWLSEDNIKYYMKNPSNIRSCTLEVDLEYPEELHDLHNDYPLAPENVEIDGTKKLIPHLGNRKNYVIHYEKLRRCL